MKLVLCLVVCITAVSCTITPDLPICQIAVGSRFNCGEFRTQESCVAAGCCYDDTIDITTNNVDRCYHSNNPCEHPSPMCRDGAKCVNNPSVEFPNDGAFDCICPPSMPEGSNCRVRQGDCNIAPVGRTACGLVNMFDNPAERCAARGCCYNNETPRVKWCFHPSAKLPKCSCVDVEGSGDV